MSASIDLPAVILDRTELLVGAVSTLVVRCGGEIDSFNAHELTEAIAGWLARADSAAAGRLVVVDLREVTFIGASAITALLVGAAGTRTGTTELRLVVGDTRPVLLVVDALGLRSTFSIHHGLSDALHAASLED